MELELDNAKIWYFPPDSEDDIPRYAIQTEKDDSGEKFLLYEEIQSLTAADVLKINPLRVSSDKMQVSFRGKPIGSVEFNSDETERIFTNFVTQWKNGIKFVEASKAEKKIPAAQLRQLRQKEEKRKQKLQLFKFLCSNLNKYINTKDIDMRLITWNLQGNSRAFESERENLKKLLNISPETKSPDMYVINLQETIVLNSLTFYSSPTLVNEWANFILKILNEDESRSRSSQSTLENSDKILHEEKDGMKYDYLVDNRLLGLCTIIIVRKYLKKQISNIEVSTTGTGILNMFGNKGAILIKFTFSYDKDISPYVNDENNELSELEKEAVVHGYKFVIVNTHLTDGEQNLSKRKKEIQAIERNLNMRDYFKDDSFYLVNPLLSDDYFNSNTNEIDSFKFNDQETIRDNKLISLEDLTKARSPVADTQTFEDVPLGQVKSSQETQVGSEKSPGSKLASPLFNSFVDKFPTSPSMSFGDAMGFKHQMSSPRLDSELSLLNDCFIFFGGDMNFRLIPKDASVDPSDETFKEEVKDLLLQKQIPSLLERDSLSIEKKNLNVLSGFNEAKINFMPTYKFKVDNNQTIKAEDPANASGLSEDTSIDIDGLSINSNDGGPSDDLPYDFLRIPSYTDRIFYSETNIYEGEEVGSGSKRYIQVNKYDSLMDCTISDHRPVYLDLTLKNLMLIDFEERYKLMKGFLKTIDYQENSNKADAEVTPVDMKFADVKILNEATEYEVTIINQGAKRFSWEIVNYDPKNPAGYLQVESTLDNDLHNLHWNYLQEPVIEISPAKGIVPSTGIMKVKIRLNSVSVGVKSIVTSLILRIIGSKDIFLTYEFTTKNSIFGESLDLLNNLKGFGSSSGIPPSIYELINYLSNHLNEGMFHGICDMKSTNKAELKQQLLSEIDISIREQLESHGALDQDYIKQTEKFADDDTISKSVLRTLIVLLHYLDGGIIPKEFANLILDEITLPSIFKLNANKNDLQSDIITKILEYLPGLRANVFMYLLSFLTLYSNKFKNADKNHLVSIFEEALISLPSDAPRVLKNKRRDVLKLLI